MMVMEIFCAMASMNSFYKRGMTCYLYCGNLTIYYYSVQLEDVLTAAHHVLIYVVQSYLLRMGIA